MDEQDKDGIHNLVQFLKETSDNPNTWLYTIKHLDVEVDKEFIISCIEKLLEKFLTQILLNYMLHSALFALKS